MMRLVYIAGYGRSGSTLLDTLLGNVDGVFSTGELNRLFHDWSTNAACSCGEALAACSVWGRVLHRVEELLPSVDPGQVAEITLRVEAIAHRLPARGLAPQTYRDAWGALLRAIHDVTGAKLIVDSSKTAYGAARRCTALAKIDDLELQIVHLVRDPRAVMWSTMRGLNRDLIRGRESRFTFAPLRTAIGWTAANVMAQLQAEGCSASRSLVRYEELVTSPRATLEHLGFDLGIDVSELVAALERGDGFPTGHGISGNRNRRAGRIALRPDFEWQEKLPRHGRLVAAATRPLAQHYGYSWHDLRAEVTAR